MTSNTQQPTGQPYKITDIWACIALHPDGTEGICAASNLMGSFPVVFSDARRLPQYRALAARCAQETGIPNTIRHYRVAEDK